MTTIYFVTGNAGKFAEVKKFVESQASHITIKQHAVDLPEIQSLDLKEVATAKALAAWNEIKHPLIIDDGGFFIDEYNNFPGTFTKYVMQGIGVEGLFRLAKSGAQSHFRNYIVFVAGPDDIHFFEGLCRGKLLMPEHYTFDKALPYRPFFVPEGHNKSLADLSDEEAHAVHHRVMALKKFLDWYGQKKAAPAKNP